MSRNVTGNMTSRAFRYGNSSLEDCSIQKNVSFNCEPYPDHPNVQFEKLVRSDTVKNKKLRISNDYMFLKARE